MKKAQSRQISITFVNPISIAKVSGCIGALMGLILGILFTLLAALGAGVNKDPAAPGWVMVIFGIGAIVFLPICYGILAFIQGLIGGWLYNLISGWAGPIEIEVK